MKASIGQGLVSPSDIADLAGVSRGAVSNWRKRSDDFPAQVEGPAAKPLFSRQEITDWLKARGYRISEDNGEQRVWALMNTLRGALDIDDAAELVLSLCCMRKLAAQNQEALAVWSDVVSGFGPLDVLHEFEWIRSESRVFGRSDAPSTLRHLYGSGEGAIREIAASIDHIDPANLGKAADAILERLAKSQVKAGAERGFPGSRTSTLLANACLSRPDRKIIYDPACGIAGALIATYDDGSLDSKFVGSDINLSAIQVARQRAFLHGVDMELHATDVLTDRSDASIKADIVLLEPPFGMRMRGEADPFDARYEFGIPRGQADMAWIQIAIASLTDTGRAFVLTPQGPLFRGGQEQRIRTELIRRGSIEAIVGLPSKMLPHVSIPLTLWVLRRPTDAPFGSILFINASELEDPETHVPGLLADPSGGAPGTFAEVAISDVLAKDALLTPSTWLSGEAIDASDVQQSLMSGLKLIHSASDVIKHQIDPLGRIPSLSGARVQNVGELIEAGMLEVQSGRPSDRYDHLPESDRRRIVSAADVRDQTVAPVETDGSERVSESELTQSRDVLVTTMHTVRTLVDVSGGHLPSTGVFRIRVTRPDALLPEYLAIVLTGTWNRAFMAGSTIQRAPIRNVEVPLLPTIEQQAVIDLMLASTRLKENAARLLQGIEQVQEAFLDSIRSGNPFDGGAPDLVQHGNSGDTSMGGIN